MQGALSKQPLAEPQLDRGTKNVSLAELYPLMREILDGGGDFTLTVTGTSMFPFILGGRDRVTLSPLTGRLKKNDLPLYRRVDGAFVLHRVVRVEKDGTYTMCGDHQWNRERGIRQEQLVALATAYVRKGKKLTNKNVLYRVYRTVWTWLLNVRPAFFRLLDLHSAVKYHFGKKKSVRR